MVVQASLFCMAGPLLPRDTRPLCLQQEGGNPAKIEIDGNYKWQTLQHNYAVPECSQHAAYE